MKPSDGEEPPLERPTIEKSEFYPFGPTTEQMRRIHEAKWAPFNEMMAREREATEQRKRKWYGRDFDDGKRKDRIYHFISWIIVIALFATAALLPASWFGSPREAFMLGLLVGGVVQGWIAKFFSRFFAFHIEQEVRQLEQERDELKRERDLLVAKGR